jgi:hypothetical protein
MALDLMPDQPTCTIAQLNARIEDLPFGLAGILRGALNQPGTTADHLLFMADAMDEGRDDVLTVFPDGCAEADNFSAAASILRDAAPRYPHPPRLPAAPMNALAADRAVRPR